MEIPEIELVEKLDRVIHVTSKAGHERKNVQLEGIKKWARNPRSGDKRSEERIERVTLDSSVCEIAVAEALGGKCNDCKFDHTKPASYAWDVVVPGYQEDAMFEVKWMSLESDWYSFNDKLIIDVEARRVHYDRIVVATNVPAECGGWNVYPRFIIDATDFSRHVKRSKYDNYKPYYYNHHNPSCTILNEQNILQRKELKV
jgi:hypothetical protein